VKAVFVDRDGVIDALVPDPVTGEPESPLRTEDVELLPGAAAALKRMRAGGWLLVGVSNQPAASKGLVSVQQLHRVQARVLELLAGQGATFDAFELCLHHPAGVVDALSGPCDCRKPAPGMLLAAAQNLGIDLKRSWMIGDTDSDVLAGSAAGCRTVLVEHPQSAHKRAPGVRPDAIASDLEAAAALVLQPALVN